MSDAKRHRQQLLNVAAAHTKIAIACGLIHEAEMELLTEREFGLPVSTDHIRHIRRALTDARVARDHLLIFLKRMP